MPAFRSSDKLQGDTLGDRVIPAQIGSLPTGIWGVLGMFKQNSLAEPPHRGAIRRIWGVSSSLRRPVQFAKRLVFAWDH